MKGKSDRKLCLFLPPLENCTKNNTKINYDKIYSTLKRYDNENL